MKKATSVAFINIRLKEDFECLKSGKFEDKELYNFIIRSIEDLKQNPM